MPDSTRFCKRIGTSLVALVSLLSSPAHAQPYGYVVRDHTAILTSYSRVPTKIVTYSFPASSPTWYRTTYPAAGLATYRPFTEREKQCARAAMQQWSDASGVVFRETITTAGVSGQILFLNYDFAKLAPWALNAFANPPTTGTKTDNDIFVRIGYACSEGLLLHEIGHAVFGFKHTFEKGYPDPVAILASDLDDRCHSVMSYHKVAGCTGKLGPLDLDALRALRG